MGKVIIGVKLGGGLVITAEGIKGERCAPLIKELADRAGGVITSSEPTTEYYEQAPEQGQSNQA